MAPLGAAAAVAGDAEAGRRSEMALEALEGRGRGMWISPGVTWGAGAGTGVGMGATTGAGAGAEAGRRPGGRRAAAAARAAAPAALGARKTPANMPPRVFAVASASWGGAKLTKFVVKDKIGGGSANAG